MIKLAAATGFLALNFYIYNWFATDSVIPPRASFSQLPAQIGDWHCREPEVIEPKIITNLGVSDYLVCTYERENPKSSVGVYVGYHATQIREEGGGGGANAIHPPKHCLPGSGWSILDASIVPLEIPGFPEGGAEVNRLVIAKGNARQLVYYWYQSRGRIIAQDWQKLLALFWDRATKRRTDGSLVRLTSNVFREQYAPAEAELLDLASVLVPELAAYVPQ